MFESIADFAKFFYLTFFAPLVEIAQQTMIFGVSLWVWILSLTVLALASVVFRRILPRGGDDK